jgi:hypothetical protein
MFGRSLEEASPRLSPGGCPCVWFSDEDRNPHASDRLTSRIELTLNSAMQRQAARVMASTKNVMYDLPSPCHGRRLRIKGELRAVIRAFPYVRNLRRYGQRLSGGVPM